MVLAMRRCIAAMLVAGLAAGCGAAAGGGRPQLLVAAAASLRAPLTEYGARFPGARVRSSFAGSDRLSAQIREGARPDVLAAADVQLPAALHAAGLVGEPVPFARNRLVLAVPAHGGAVRSLADLARPGVSVVIGSPTVPVGSYTRTVLARLPAAQRRAILANVRSQEPDVAGVVAKLRVGAADAGFTYVTDVVAAGGALRAIELPQRLEPDVVYAAAVVVRARHPAQARQYIAGLLRGAGRAALRRAGFRPPP
jgi:molybdate transport system substrate-binding protein